MLFIPTSLQSELLPVCCFSRGRSAFCLAKLPEKRILTIRWSFLESLTGPLSC